MDQEIAASTVAALARAQCGVVVAPAGHGKTEAICSAIGSVDGRILVLTHTNAGVAALKDRLERLKSSSARVEVTTISKWAYRICRAYPQTASWSDNDDFDECTNGAVRLVAAPFFGRVLRATFDAVYVDEYQDCNESQHALVCALVKHLPCRVLGDPLQAIYAFGSKRVEWDEVVESFGDLGDLPVPWRWQHRPQLGQWLLAARQTLLSGKSVPIGGPIERVAPSDRAGLWRCCDRAGTTLILGTPLGRRYIALGKQVAKLGFKVVEATERPDLGKAAKQLDKASGNELALCILELAAKWMTGVSKSSLSPIYKYFRKGFSSSKQNLMLRSALVRAAEDGSAKSISDAFHALANVGRVYRSEIFWPLIRALRRMSTGDITSVSDAVELELASLRFRQQRLPRRAVASTLLAKGLQADNVIIFNPETLDVRNLYVALTRATNTITVITGHHELTPAC